MAWQQPKLTWQPAEPLTNNDMNRIEGNIDYLKTDLDNHKASSSGVHGVSGTVVGTSDSQTLTNKTLGAGNKLGANLDASSYTIVNLKAPTNANDAARKADVDAVNTSLTNHTSANSGVHGVAGNVVGTSDTQTLTNKTLGSGTVLAADLNANSNKIINLAAPTSANDAATKGYIDSNFVKLTDYEDADVLAKIKNVDGSGSGLDADLLDGKHASSFVLKSGDTITGNLTLSNGSLYLPSSGFSGAGQIQSTGTVKIANGSSAQELYVKQISVTNSWSDADYNKVTNGIYTKGGIKTKGVITSLVADGTAPFSVSSATKVTNLHADLLDGYHASSFVKTSDYDDTDVLAKIKNVDGSGSGLDADLLDGKHASDFLQVSNIYYVETSSGQSYTIPNGTIIAYFNGGGNLDITLPSPSNYIGKFLYVLLEFPDPSPSNGVTFFTQPGHFFIPGGTELFFVLGTSAFEGTSYKYLRGTLSGSSTFTNYHTFGFVFTALSSTKWALVARY